MKGDEYENMMAKQIMIVTLARLLSQFACSLPGEGFSCQEICFYNERIFAVGTRLPRCARNDIGEVADRFTVAWQAPTALRPPRCLRSAPVRQGQPWHGMQPA